MSTERIRLLEKEIEDMEKLLREDTDGGWCLGDPYEALERMKKTLEALRSKESE
jgi:hypothetical protein